MDVSNTARLRAGPTHAPTTLVVLIGGTAATFGLDAADGPLRTCGAVVVTEVSGPPRVTGELLASLAAADVTVLVLAGDGLAPAAQHISLLAWHMHGELPIIVTPSAGAATRQALERYAQALGATLPPVIDSVHALAGAVDQAIQRIGERNAAAPFRLSITSRNAKHATLSGSVLAGVAKPGLEAVVLPQGSPAIVTGVETAAEGGKDLVVHLDTAISADPGQVLVAADARPECADQVAAHIVWLGKQPLLPGRPYRLALAGQSTTAQIGALKHKINAADLDPIAARQLELGEVGLCNVSFATPLIFDQALPGRQTVGGISRFTLEDPTTGSALGIGQILFTLRRATNIHWQALAIDKSARAALKDQRPCCLWFTGLSGSGKSTVASLLEKRLNAMRRHTYTLDGDNVRHGLNRDLGFTDADRVENIRRIAEVSKLFVDAGLIVMVSFISPFRAERDMARTLFPPGEFLEIYIDTSIDICERRDPKGLYKKARAGQLKNFTGIDSPYEPPSRAELRLDGGSSSPEALVEQILRELARRGMVDLAH